MDGTILGQGSFVVPSTVVQQIVQIPSNADWMEVYNFTQLGNIGTPASATGLQFIWQRGMSAGTGIVFYGASGVKTLSADTMLTGGFTLYDPSVAIVPSNVALSALTAANPAVATVTNTNNVYPGSIVRLNNLSGAKQNVFNGIDFSVGYGTLTATTFSVDYLNSTGTTSGAGDYQLIPYDALYYPRRRIITNITAANPAVITLSVDHGYTVGQEIRLNLPGGTAVWGQWAALSNYGFSPTSSTSPNSYIITAVDTAVGNGHNTITINADTSGFTTNSFLNQWINIALPYSPAQVIPIGEDTATSISSIAAQTPVVNGIQIYGTQTGLLADATVNTGFLGMILGTSGNGKALTTAITGPAGSASGDVIYWKAGKSTYGGL